MTSPLLLGSHVSIAGGASLSIDRALSIGATAMQIFVKNNMQWFAKPLTDEERDAFTQHPRRGEIGSIFGHSGYMINLGAINPEFHEKSLRALREELIRADAFGLPFLVLHPGAHMGRGEAEGLQAIVDSLDTVLAAIPEVQTKVALETTAGQGTWLGHTFEQLAWILEHAAQPERLTICIDTAHLFAAGYDLTSEESAAQVFEEFHRLIGFQHLAALHCNDSKSALGSRVDRHEHIGKGKIGIGAFRYLMRESRLAAIPKVLETPKGKEMKEDQENMELLRSLMA